MKNKTKKTNRKIETSVTGTPLHGKRLLPVYAGGQYTIGADTLQRIGASSSIVTAVSSTAKLLTVRDNSGKSHEIKFANLGLPVTADASGTPAPVKSVGGKFVSIFTNPVHAPAPASA